MLRLVNKGKRQAGAERRILAVFAGLQLFVENLHVVAGAFLGGEGVDLPALEFIH